MIKLSIRRFFNGQVQSLDEAQRKFCQLRDESLEGASTFPNGRVTINKKVYTISYNGKLWDGETLIANAPAY